MQTYLKIKRRIFQIISKAEKGDRASEIFDWTIIALIFLSILAIVLDSFQSIHQRHYPVFRTVEIITVVIFTTEYLLRIWTADLQYPNAKHPHLRYCFSPMAIIDLLAILPFYLPYITPGFQLLRLFRVFRLLKLSRVLKLGRYLNALRVIFHVIRQTAAQLVMSVVLCLFVMLFSAIIMYEAENPIQPEAFPNILASMWWAICTLTTVGYGDIYPITSIGRILASVISIVGIGIIAIPTGIIAAGFAEAVREEHPSDEINPEKMEDDDLLILQGKINKALAGRGYVITVSGRQESGGKAGSASPES